jgi:uncharacterized protein (DUF2141 family)
MTPFCVRDPDHGSHGRERLYDLLRTPALVCAVLFAAVFAEAQTDTLVVRVCDITHAGGFIDLTVYKNDSHYLSDDSFVVCQRLAVSGTRTYVPLVLPAGEYAFVVYHDLNSNGTLDANLFGYPTEPLAFSRPFRVTFRAPRFNEISFLVNKPRDTIDVMLPK